MTTHQAHSPIPRQLWIQQRCIAVENQFNGRIGRAAFAARFLPLLALLALAYWNGSQASPIIIPWITFPIVAEAFYLAILALAHRFHDMGQSGANLLQVLLPLFIWLYVGDDLMAKLPTRLWIATAEILAIWPAHILLRLCYTPGTGGELKT